MTTADQDKLTISRRGLLGGAAAAASASLLGGMHVLAAEAPKPAPPARKIKLGWIGCGGRGTWLAPLFLQHGGYVIHEGYIYGNHEGGWTCLELASGQKKWHERAVGKGSLCFADNMLFLFSENSGQAGLATCSPDGLQLKGKVKVKGDGPSWAHPVVVGGRLYLRYDTHLYCFDVKNPG